MLLAIRTDKQWPGCRAGFVALSIRVTGSTPGSSPRAYLFWKRSSQDYNCSTAYGGDSLWLGQS